MKYVVAWTYRLNGTAAEKMKACDGVWPLTRNGRRRRARRITSSLAASTAVAGSRWWKPTIPPS